MLDIGEHRGCRAVVVLKTFSDLVIEGFQPFDIAHLSVEVVQLLTFVLELLVELRWIADLRLHLHDLSCETELLGGDVVLFLRGRQLQSDLLHHTSRKSIMFY